MGDDMARVGIEYGGNEGSRGYRADKGRKYVSWKRMGMGVMDTRRGWGVVAAWPSWQDVSF